MNSSNNINGVISNNNNVNNNTAVKRTTSSESPQSTDCDYHNSTELNDRSLKKTKYSSDSDDPTPIQSKTIPTSSNPDQLQDLLFDGAYNEDSDADWHSIGDNNSESSGDDLLQAALRLDDDVDVEEVGDDDIEYNTPWTSYTEEEMEVVKNDAREIGLMKFIEKYVIQEHVPVAKLLEAFGFTMHPRAIMLTTDLDLAPILRTVVNRYLRKRQRLEHVSTLEDVVELMNKAEKIMVVTGAGVSVSCGIPDFRSETGIYSRLQEYQLDDPQQMFDIEYFRDSPEIFYSFAKELYPSKYQPSPSHHFVKLIEEKGKLLRNYTQNIDTLEHKANIKNVVNCHGSFATASCVTCGYKCDGKDIEEYIFSQTVPPCPECLKRKAEKKPNKNNDKYNSDDDDDDEDDTPRGTSIIKPDITFFGEKLPDEFDHLLAIDTDQVDLLIVMGSSLKVSPVSEIMTQIPHRIPQILINRTPITHMTFDVQLLGNSDDIVPELCRMLNWDLRHEKLPGGSSLSEESIQHSQHGDGDTFDIIDKDTNQVKDTGKRIWKYVANGLYTFPGAVLDDRYFNAQRCDERGSTNDDGYTHKSNEDTSENISDNEEAALDNEEITDIRQENQDAN
ncbi:DHS-like NAD/FAD-binding domain-containing protein [Cunninghamella echinulata]|nr:DHS-like NAD/FAD-binding domain-containing protein [Cunninghamella echinulata]